MSSVVVVVVASWGSAAVERPWRALLTPTTDETTILLGSSTQGRMHPRHPFPRPKERRVQSHGKRGRKPFGRKPWQLQPKS